MNYKIFIYAIVFLVTCFACSGINFKDFFKKGHILEARIFIMLVIMGLSYLVSSFIIAFIEM